MRVSIEIQLQSLRTVFVLLALVAGLLITPVSAQNSDVHFAWLLHDFGTVNPNQEVVQYDFLFKNTGDAPVQVAGVSAGSKQLQWVHTRSAVAAGEFGFVKLQLKSGIPSGPFAEWILVEFQAGERQWKTALNLKAFLDSAQSNEPIDPIFVDSEISTTVKVLPEDVDRLGEGPQLSYPQLAAEVDPGLEALLDSNRNQLLNLDNRLRQQTETVAALQAQLAKSEPDSAWLTRHKELQLKWRLLIAERDLENRRLMAIKADLARAEQNEAALSQRIAELENTRQDAEKRAGELAEQLEKRFAVEAEAALIQKELALSLERTEARQIVLQDSLQHLQAQVQRSNIALEVNSGKIKQLKDSVFDLQTASASNFLAQQELAKELTSKKEAFYIAQKALAEVQQENDSLQNSQDFQNREHQQKLTRLKRELADNQLTTANYASVLKQTQANQEQLQQALSTAQDSLAHWFRESQKLQHTVADEQTNFQYSEKDLIAVKEQLASATERENQLQAQLRRSEEKSWRLKAQGYEAEKRTADLSALLATTQKQLQQYQGTRNETTEQLQSQERLVARLEADLKHYRSESTRLDTNLRAVQQKLFAAEDQGSRLRDDLQNTQSKLLAVNLDYQATREEQQQLALQVEDLDTQLAVAQKDGEQLRLAILSWKADHKDLSIRHKETQNQLTATRQQQEETDRQNARLTQDLAASEETKRQQVDQISRLNEQLKSEQQAQLAAQTQLTKADERYRLLSNQLQNTQSEKEELAAELQEKTRTELAYQQRLEQLHAEIHSSKSGQSAMDERISYLQAALTEGEKASVERKSRIQNLEDQLARQGDLAKEKQLQLAQLREELAQQGAATDRALQKIHLYQQAALEAERERSELADQLQAIQGNESALALQQQALTDSLLATQSERKELYAERNLLRKQLLQNQAAMRINDQQQALVKAQLEESNLRERSQRGTLQQQRELVAQLQSKESAQQHQIGTLQSELADLHIQLAQKAVRQEEERSYLATTLDSLKTLRETNHQLHNQALEQQSELAMQAQEEAQMNSRIASLNEALAIQQAQVEKGEHKIRLYQNAALAAEKERSELEALLQGLQKNEQQLIAHEQGLQDSLLNSKELLEERDLLRSQLLKNQEDMAWLATQQEEILQQLQLGQDSLLNLHETNQQLLAQSQKDAAVFAQLQAEKGSLEQALTEVQATPASTVEDQERIEALEKEITLTVNALDKAKQLAQANRAKYEEENRRRKSAEVFALEMQSVAEEQIAAKEALTKEHVANRKPNPIHEEAIEYRVQVLVSNVPVNPDSSLFQGYGQVKEYQQGPQYKYTIGRVSDFESAEVLREQLRAEGFDFPLIVAFKGSQRIALKEAIESSEAVLGDL